MRCLHGNSPLSSPHAWITNISSPRNPHGDKKRGLWITRIWRVGPTILLYFLLNKDVELFTALIHRFKKIVYLYTYTR